MAAITLLASATVIPSFAAAVPSAHTTLSDSGLVLSDVGDRPARSREEAEIAELLVARTRALAAASALLAQAQQDFLLARHHKRASAGAKLVKTEIARIRNLSTFLWPTEGGVGSPFGWRVHPILGYRKFHNGADIGGACNNPIYAAQSGIVVKTGTGYSGGSGNNVRLNHGTIEGRNIQTAYLHMTRFIVKTGQRVNKGQLIGYVGSTGLSTACHLHLSLYKDGVGSDPLEYVKK